MTNDEVVIKYLAKAVNYSMSANRFFELIDHVQAFIDDIDGDEIRKSCDECGADMPAFEYYVMCGICGNCHDSMIREMEGYE